MNEVLGIKRSLCGIHHSDLSYYVYTPVTVCV